LVSGAIADELPKPESIGITAENASAAHDDQIIDKRFVPLETSLEEELDEGGNEVLKAMREKQRALIDALPLDQ
jgi:N-acetyltransferase 10